MTSGGNLGPVPTGLVLLRALPTVNVGEKVRFLGCVEHYAVSEATLTLQHHGQQESEGSVYARVGIELLLSTVSLTDLQVGAWLNIIGYTRTEAAQMSLSDLFPGAQKEQKRSNRKKRPDVDSQQVEVVDVQAVMLWSTGAIDVGQYEAAVQARQLHEPQIIR